MNKMNVFHWHLTDDQGWRIEIKKYPKLTEIGSKREKTLVDYYYVNYPQVFDGIEHGGYYTQEQIKEVVAYAASKYINVIPEIEMPGHALAALLLTPNCLVILHRHIKYHLRGAYSNRYSARARPLSSSLKESWMR